MLLGITFSNLSIEQKNLKDKRNFFKPNLSSALSPALGKITPLPSARWWHSANTWRRQPPNGRRMAGVRAGHVRSLCRVPPGQHSAKGTCCRVPLFADGRHSATFGYAVWQMFAECSLPGTRQTMSLPSARVLALGKGRDTRQIWVFR